MIMHGLLKEFLEQDCDAAVHQKLIAEITRHGAVRTEVVREFTFNRFNICLDFQNGNVRVEDELDTSEAGSCSVSLADFASALNEHEPQR